MSGTGQVGPAGGSEMLTLASTIVAAYVGNNPVPAAELPGMIKAIWGTLCGLTGAPNGNSGTTQKPAIPVKKSITPDYIVCLEDGKKLKMLKRYLRGNFNMTPEQYRAK